MNASKNLHLTTKQMTLVGLMTAVLCILGPISFVIPISPIPISLGMLGIYFVLYVLGWKLGSLSVVIYILLGLVGLPVFTGFTGGAGKLLGPTGGYIIGYLFMALICGFFLEIGKKSFALRLLGMVLGTLVCYLFGTLWLSFQASISFSAALAEAVLPFLPADALKLTLALLIAPKLRNRLKRAGLL